jgi:hypothetical protein
VSFKNQYFARFVESCKSLIYNPDRRRRSTPELAGLCLIVLAVSVLLYAFAVYIPDDETGKTLTNPRDVPAHLMVFAVAVPAAIIFILVVVAIATFFETEWCSTHLLRFSSILGMSSTPNAFGAVRRALRTLEKEKASLETAVLRYKQAAQTVKLVHTLKDEPRYTLARVRLSRLQRRAESAKASAKAFLYSDELFSQATDAFDYSCPPRRAAEWCYISLSGPVKHPTVLALLARFQIAGLDPLAITEIAWSDELVGERHDFAALALAPRWVCHHVFKETMYIIGTSHYLSTFPPIRLTEPVAAAGTYKDTVAALWTADRWSTHHQPERLVWLARRLDSRRKDGAEAVP